MRHFSILHRVFFSILFTLLISVQGVFAHQVPLGAAAEPIPTSVIQRIEQNFLEGLIGPELVLAFLGIFAIGYLIFSLIPAALVFFIGRPLLGRGGFGWTYLGTMTGGLLFGFLMWLWNKFTGGGIGGIINFDFAVLGWGLVGMLAGAVFGLVFRTGSPEAESTKSAE